MLADDYGLHRFCKECGVELDERYDELGDLVWIHPEDDCVFSSNVMDPDDIWTGIASRKEMTMDDLRKVYLSLNRPLDIEWLRWNKSILEEIYKKYADDANEDKSVPINPDFSVEKYKDLYFGMVDPEGTKLSPERYHSAKYASYCMLRSPRKVMEKMLSVSWDDPKYTYTIGYRKEITRVEGRYSAKAKRYYKLKSGSKTSRVKYIPINVTYGEYLSRLAKSMIGQFHPENTRKYQKRNSVKEIKTLLASPNVVRGKQLTERI